MQALINELEFGINHLPPSVPEDIVAEIKIKFAELKNLGDKVNEETVENVVTEIGKMEWPYRRAYHRLVQSCCTQTEFQMMMGKLSPKTKKKFETIGGKDAPLQEVLKSKVFEEKLSPEEWYEIQEAALNAKLEMAEYMKKYIESRKEEFEKYVQEEKQEQKKLEDAIDTLRGMASIDEHWGPDILSSVQQAELGWSIIEPDVSLGDIQKDIEYWQTVLAGGGE